MMQGMPAMEGHSWPLRRHGDEVERVPGGFYVAHGRCDDTMNLGGIKVYLPCDHAIYTSILSAHFSCSGFDHFTCVAHLLVNPLIACCVQLHHLCLNLQAHKPLLILKILKILKTSPCWASLLFEWELSNGLTPVAQC